MIITNEAIREYKLRIQDILNTREKVERAIKSGALPEEFEGQTATIPESEITAFCSGCDYFKGEEIPCEMVGSDDQARCAARGWCGCASINGKRVVKKVV